MDFFTQNFLNILEGKAETIYSNIEKAINTYEAKEGEIRQWKDGHYQYKNGEFKRILNFAESEVTNPEKVLKEHQNKTPKEIQEEREGIIEKIVNELLSLKGNEISTLYDIQPRTDKYTDLSIYPVDIGLKLKKLNYTFIKSKDNKDIIFQKQPIY